MKNRWKMKTLMENGKTHGTWKNHWSSFNDANWWNTQRPKGPPSCEARSRLASLAERLPWQSPLGAVGFGGGILHNCRDFHLKIGFIWKWSTEFHGKHHHFHSFSLLFSCQKWGAKARRHSTAGWFNPQISTGHRRRFRGISPCRLLGYHRKIPWCLVNDIPSGKQT